jgi:hypothetical protein
MPPARARTHPHTHRVCACGRRDTPNTHPSIHRHNKHIASTYIHTDTLPKRYPFNSQKTPLVHEKSPKYLQRWSRDIVANPERLRIVGIRQEVPTATPAYATLSLSGTEHERSPPAHLYVGKMIPDLTASECSESKYSESVEYVTFLHQLPQSYHAAARVASATPACTTAQHRLMDSAQRTCETAASRH